MINNTNLFLINRLGCNFVVFKPQKIHIERNTVGTIIPLSTIHLQVDTQTNFSPLPPLLTHLTILFEFNDPLPLHPTLTHLTIKGNCPLPLFPSLTHLFITRVANYGFTDQPLPSFPHLKHLVIHHYASCHPLPLLPSLTHLSIIQY